jgi:hypothetical protein
MPFVRPLVVALRLVRELRNFDSLRCGFYREPILPATGIAGQLTVIIDYELGGESRIALPDRPKRLVRNVTGKMVEKFHARYQDPHYWTGVITFMGIGGRKPA